MTPVGVFCFARAFSSFISSLVQGSRALRLYFGFALRGPCGRLVSRAASKKVFLPFNGSCQAVPTFSLLRSSSIRFDASALVRPSSNRESSPPVRKAS